MSTAPRILGADSPRQNQDAKVIGRHYDYQVRMGAISNGATSKIMELPIQLGAPFCLRGVGGYNVAAGSFATAALTGGFIEFTDSQDQWLATEEIGISADWPGGGLDAQYEPVYQQIVYGPESVIQVRLKNSSGADWADPRIVFRGSQLFFKDRMYAPSYPACYNAFPYSFPVEVARTPTAAGQSFRDIPLQVLGADYALRGAVLTLISGAIADLEVTLKDQAGRPYSNDFIHHNWLFSTALAQRPGIFYPEIYLPKDRILLMDLFQGANAAFNVEISTMGVRVFPK